MVIMQTFFIALADRTRRRILNLMRERNEICVWDFTEVLKISQPKISRHLAYLRRAGIVSARREGKWSYYRIVEPEDFYAAQILRGTLDWLKTREQMQDDYARLLSIYSIGMPQIVDRSLAQSSELDVLPEADMISRRRDELETFLL